jgi:hypothetical protein
MTRHASAEELALLAEGELRRRKAAKVSAHVAGCTQCTQVRAELTEVTTVLSAVPYPPLPAAVSVQIESALRIEVNHRIAEAPATEAARGVLPARSRRQRAGGVQRGWHLPGLSVPATRLVAAAGAVVLVGGGGYLVASNLHSAVPTSSSASGTAPSTNQSMTAGPNVTYGSPGSQHTIHSVSSKMNFVPKELRTQVLAAYHEAQVKGEAGNVSFGGTNAPSAGPVRAAASPLEGSAAAASGGGGGGAVIRLAGCIKAVADGRMVLLLDLARYEGKPAAIVVLGSTTTSQAEVIVTANGCSAASPDVLTRVPLGHL